MGAEMMWPPSYHGSRVTRMTCSPRGNARAHVLREKNDRVCPSPVVRTLHMN